MYRAKLWLVVCLGALVAAGCTYERKFDLDLKWSGTSTHDGDPVQCPDNQKPGSGYEPFDVDRSLVDAMQNSLKDFELISWTASSTVNGDTSAQVGYNDYSISLAYEETDTVGQTTVVVDQELVNSSDVSCTTPISVIDVTSANECLEKMRVFINADADARQALIDAVRISNAVPSGVSTGGSGHCSSTAPFDVSWETVLKIRATVELSTFGG
jgi:hypothetical protein